MKSIFLAAIAALTLSGCSGEEISLEDYAAEVETAVWTMHSRIDPLDEILDSPTLSIDDLRTYFVDKVAARDQFLEAMGQLEPPEEAVDLHESALGILRRLRDSEAGLGALSLESASPQAVWESPEAAAMRRIDQEAVAICLAAEAEFDATGARVGVFAGTPWVPVELEEVIQVALECEGRDA